MNVETLTLGPLGTNCYLVWAEGGDPTVRKALLVDCAGGADEILEAAGRHSLSIESIVGTHGHTDHIECLAELKEATGARIAIHELDAPMLADPMLSGAALFGFSQRGVQPDVLLHEADHVTIPGSEVSLSVLHTPGHSPGSISLLGEGVLFSGDCLFAGGIGRVDLAGGDEREMMASLVRLSALDPKLVVYPGHGPATTIGAEAAGNPWLADL